MEATQTDVEYPQLTSQEDGSMDGLVNGIMEQMDGDPNQAGTVKPKAAKDAEEVEEESTDTAETDTPDEPDKFIIKWQGKDKEVTQAELYDLAQKGFDYTQKTQSLAEERNRLAPYEGLANLIKSDPTKANQIAAILAGQAPQKPPEQKTFDDPIDELEDRILTKAEQRIMGRMAQQQATAAGLQQVERARAQFQADPDFPIVHQRIIEMIQNEPLLSRQREMHLELDQNPASYARVFQHFKNQLAPKPTTTEPPKPVKKETRAPILEAGGVEAPDGIEGKAKAERISKMKAKALRSGDPTSVADWLKASGAIEHLY